jgi:hypothetical protein
MEKKIFRAIIFLVPLLFASPGYAAKISWTLPTSFANGTPIDPASVQKIVVKVYSGPTMTGPWKWMATSSPGASSATVQGPGLGETLWYTCTATLDGEESGHATAVSKTNLVDVEKIFLFFRRKHIPHAKKIAFLLFLLLLAGFLSAIRFRRKKAEGKRR